MDLLMNAVLSDMHVQHTVYFAGSFLTMVLVYIHVQMLPKHLAKPQMSTGAYGMVSAMQCCV